MALYAVSRAILQTLLHTRPSVDIANLPGLLVCDFTGWMHFLSPSQKTVQNTKR